MKCEQCFKREATRGAVCARCLARRVRVLRRYSERWDERCAREVARWAYLAEGVEARGYEANNALIADGFVALNAVAMQSTGAARPSRRTRLDLRAFRMMCRSEAGYDALAARVGAQPFALARSPKVAR